MKSFRKLILRAQRSWHVSVWVHLKITFLGLLTVVGDAWAGKEQGTIPWASRTFLGLKNHISCSQWRLWKALTAASYLTVKHFEALEAKYLCYWTLCLFNEPFFDFSFFLPENCKWVTCVCLSVNKRLVTPHGRISNSSLDWRKYWCVCEATESKHQLEGETSCLMFSFT